MSRIKDKAPASVQDAEAGTGRVIVRIADSLTLSGTIGNAASSISRAPMAAADAKREGRSNG